MSFGQRLKQARKNAKKTQKQVATRLGVDISTISKYENNHSEPDNDTLLQLAEEYSVTLNWLITGKEAEDTSLYASTNVDIRAEVDQIVEILESIPEAERKSFLDQVDTLAEIVKRKYEKSRSQ
ncbi:helix-turn-helix domain-containing protein [Brevibacillus porteri]|uniref:helix-turn-helix domain-containing protein n=1 Tax=Brevibacillus porteri TaxID=2126350 RepID=UPI001FC9623D|nr:helix-turn-helix transcriptional regulator [Brevibacillus porteri]MED1800643.1 helix-turn-helix transcriptional regulator [Brevibacillus porteri]MED2134729.1 helix-turn-helix transcriptional regulator [Brevibacillus porteri]MED2745614.1 helix-turn-helix transcriptional regulator [Brevibacillus porteri]MED2814748.1 helix-turn-helix transcriptional regulator [Brevibacillus porteri]MED2896322.1 helix-turn-helix transcriptional regulator [Brevibacillus porteri]